MCAVVHQDTIQEGEPNCRILSYFRTPKSGEHVNVVQKSPFGSAEWHHWILFFTKNRVSCWSPRGPPTASRRPRRTEQKVTATRKRSCIQVQWHLTPQGLPFQAAIRSYRLPRPESSQQKKTPVKITAPVLEVSAAMASASRLGISVNGRAP